MGEVVTLFRDRFASTLRLTVGFIVIAALPVAWVVVMVWGFR